MAGDHPIFDGPFGSHDLMPTFIELGARRFDIQFEWKDYTNRYSGDSGWIAFTIIDGNRFSGSIGTPLRSLFDLVRQLKNNFQIQQETVITDIPIGIERLSQLMHSESR